MIHAVGQIVNITGERFFPKLIGTRTSAQRAEKESIVFCVVDLDLLVIFA